MREERAHLATEGTATEAGPRVRVVAVPRDHQGWGVIVAEIPMSVLERFEVKKLRHPGDLKSISSEKALMALFGNVHGISVE